MQFPTLLGGASAAKRKAEEAPAAIDFGELLTKVEAAETKVRSLIGAAVPEVKLQLPRLETKSFESAASRRAADHGAAFAAVPSPPDATDVELGSAAEGLLQTSGASRGNKTAETIAGLARQLRAPLLAAASSLTLVVAAALAGVGAIPAAVVVVVASTTGSICVWHARVANARTLVLEKLEASVASVLDVVRDVKESLLGLSDNVVAAIDKMAEEQQPALQKIRELESTLDVDVPDPNDLKRPLEGCRSKALSWVAQVEETIPSMINELASASFIGKLAMDPQLFIRVVVGLPALAILALNLSLAFAQLAFGVAQHAAQHDGAQHGAHDVRAATKAFEVQRSNATLDAVLHPEQGLDWSAYLNPWMSQMGLMFVQVAVAMLLSEASWLCTFANGMLTRVEEKANISLNDQVSTVVGQVCGQSFSEVAAQCDMFFPRFKDTLSKLEQAMELARKAEALAAEADKLRSFAKW